MSDFIADNDLSYSAALLFNVLSVVLWSTMSNSWAESPSPYTPVLSLASDSLCESVFLDVSSLYHKPSSEPTLFLFPPL